MSPRLSRGLIFHLNRPITSLYRAALMWPVIPESGQEKVLGQLLGDRAGPARKLPPFDVLLYGLPQLVVVDALVLVKTRILRDAHDNLHGPSIYKTKF